MSENIWIIWCHLDSGNWAKGMLEQPTSLGLRIDEAVD
ncbi:hypothetical protein DES37_10138 [Mangrovibacter plantisponsor]|uniref:Uncharacterized protein n=1 Tax=Mangrovibacter plantisponsor TaxID=451513 RepID=A0A317Q9L0_9ENTR|nr:hypothetical protein DES37_10138 [Mangrovibacter plantisponsor]